MSSTIGIRFKVTTFGESHGPAIGSIIDGCPARLQISVDDIQAQLNRRRPGQSRMATSRKEADKAEILSGIENGLTLGSPIALLVRNTDLRKTDYQSIRDIPRPSHADYTYGMKYGIQASSGGGRASARETIGRVAAGAIAEKFLTTHYHIEVVAWVSSIGNIDSPEPDHQKISREKVDKTSVRCPDTNAAKKMEAAVNAAKTEDDSIGGIITCICRNVPAGWGEPVFNKLEALLAHAMMSIPAVKGFEVGTGFQSSRQRGSEHNDLFIKKGNSLGTVTNNSGGIQGGISNGEPVLFRVAFKPTASIGKEQKTADYNGAISSLSIPGRHDPCIVPRAVPIVEAMAALILADTALCELKEE